MLQRPMLEPLIVGRRPLAIEDVEQSARFNRHVELDGGARERIHKGRAALEAQLDAR